jgi:hypothetical protein
VILKGVEDNKDELQGGTGCRVIRTELKILYKDASRDINAE